MSLLEPGKFLPDTKTAHATHVPVTLKDAIFSHNVGLRRWDLVLPEFFDFYYKSADPQERAAMLAEEPPMPLVWQTQEPHPVSHVYLGGIAEWLAGKAGIPAPEWTTHPSRFSADPIYPSGEPFSEERKEELRASELPELARRNFFVNDRMHERSHRWISGFEPADTAERPQRGTRPVTPNP